MKTPERRQASSGVVGEQLTLLDPPKLSAEWPKSSTLAERALRFLLNGEGITSPEFQSETKSWRLAAYVRTLKRGGWPVESAGVPFPPAPLRTIAIYWLPPWAIDEVRGSRHA